MEFSAAAQISTVSLNVWTLTCTRRQDSNRHTAGLKQIEQKWRVFSRHTNRSLGHNHRTLRRKRVAGRLCPPKTNWKPRLSLGSSLFLFKVFKDTLPDAVTADFMIITKRFGGLLTNWGYNKFWVYKKINFMGCYKRLLASRDTESKSVSASLSFDILCFLCTFHKNTAGALKRREPALKEETTRKSWVTNRRAARSGTQSHQVQDEGRYVQVNRWITANTTCSLWWVGSPKAPWP